MHDDGDIFRGDAAASREGDGGEIVPRGDDGGGVGGWSRGQLFGAIGADDERAGVGLVRGARDEVAERALGHAEAGLALETLDHVIEVVAEVFLCAISIRGREAVARQRRRRAATAASRHRLLLFRGGEEGAGRGIFSSRVVGASRTLAEDARGRARSRGRREDDERGALSRAPRDPSRSRAPRVARASGTEGFAIVTTRGEERRGAGVSKNSRTRRARRAEAEAELPGRARGTAVDDGEHDEGRRGSRIVPRVRVRGVDMRATRVRRPRRRSGVRSRHEAADEAHVRSFAD